MYCKPKKTKETNKMGGSEKKLKKVTGIYQREGEKTCLEKNKGLEEEWRS